jgi:AAA15 family ATPase/GTPase
MAINHVEIQDFLVFKGEFAADFCPGVNVLIGGNGTGKTTIMRKMYTSSEVHRLGPSQSKNFIVRRSGDEKCVFIPEKDILEHAKGLLPFIIEKQTGFSSIFMDVLVKAQDIPTQKQSDLQKDIGKTISKIIDGKVEWDQGDGSFYTIKTDGARIPFANEASGFKKFGLLGLLVSCGQLEPGTILFWDEPENSLNPELIPKLVEILLELAKNGVQIFIATHSEILASYFSVLKSKNDSVMFYSLYKDGERINVASSDRFEWLNPNKLTEEPVKLYEKRLDKVFGNE